MNMGDKSTFKQKSGSNGLLKFLKKGSYIKEPISNKAKGEKFPRPGQRI
jgi:hypothetical protein